MMSERTFAASFSGFWAELLPLLTPTFVHMINEGFKERLTDEFGLPLEAVEKRADSHDSAVIAEFAFFLAKAAADKRIGVDEVFQDHKLRTSAERCAIEIVEIFEAGRGLVPTALAPGEQKEGLALAQNYERFFHQRPHKGVIEFGPKIPGAGFLVSCIADISIGHALFEVKTVNRNLAGKDIRQLIVYLALQAATGDRRWTVAGFFNPRRAVYHEFDVDEVIPQMSGGKPAAEVFHELIDFVCTRDIQMDTAF